MSGENRHGRTAALAGLALHTVLAGLLLSVWLISNSLAAEMVFWLSLGGIPVWLISIVLLHSRHLAEVESLEMDMLAHQSNKAALFEQDAESRLAMRRQRWMERFLAPAGTILLSIFYLLMAFWLGSRLLTSGIDNARLAGSALTWGFFCLGGAFLAFLFSRYALGMARLPSWQLLRPGGSFMGLAVLGSGLLAAMFFLLHASVNWGVLVVACLAPILMALIGLELLLNFILDFYRPRLAGAEARPGFDSRMATFISEPGSVARSIAEAMNYQFGFEVSSTWFYQLLQKTFVPLLLFGMLSVLLLSSLVLVGPGQQAVILTWGIPAVAEPLSPGVHLKWPWPIQTADVIDQQSIRTMTVGVGDVNPGGETIVNGIRLYLWTSEHGAYREQNILVARGHAGETTPSRSRDVTVSLMRMVLDIQYRVKDMHKFQYTSAGAENLLRQAATRELTHYAATRDVDTLMTSQRHEVGRDLQAAIGRHAEPLGIEIVLVALQGIHPPPEAAGAFEDVIKADREAEGLKFAAQTTRAMKLSAVAGSPDVAQELAATIRQLRQANSNPNSDSEQISALENQAETLLKACGGDAKELWNQARSDRWRQTNDERARLESLKMQLTAYQAAPNLYLLDKKLQVLSEGLLDARKYVLGIDPAQLEVWWNFNQQRSVTGGLNFGQ